MSLRGSSTGNGAGWPTRLADSAANIHTLFVSSRNSSRLTVLVFPPSLLAKSPFEKRRMYSCTSLNVGFVADFQLTHAVEGPALLPLFQITSPRIANPRSSISLRDEGVKGDVRLPTDVGNVDACPPFLNKDPMGLPKYSPKKTPIFLERQVFIILLVRRGGDHEMNATIRELLHRFAVLAEDPVQDVGRNGILPCCHRGNRRGPLIQAAAVEPRGVVADTTGGTEARRRGFLGFLHKWYCQGRERLQMLFRKSTSYLLEHQAFFEATQRNPRGFPR